MINGNKVYKGIQYKIYWHELDDGRSGMAFYCAYVRLPHKHPYRRFCLNRYKWSSTMELWKMKKMMAEQKEKSFIESRPKKPYFRWLYDGHASMNISVHGGLTFSRRIENGKNYLSKGNWIGWDYGHVGDNTYNPNPKKIDLQMDTTSLKKLNEGGKMWTEEEIEIHCKDVIDQLLKIK